MWPFLDDEQREAVDAFSRFCRQSVRPATKPYDRGLGVPEDVLREQLKKLIPFGLGTGRIPAEHGGLGLDPVTAGLLFEAGSQHAPGVAGPAFITESVGLLLSRYGSETVRHKYLEPLVAGEVIAASANTEPSGGSDVRSVSTRAARTAGGYAITGRKVWITNGQYADFATVLARSDETGQLDLYVVDRREHGFGSTPLETVGAVETAELVFDGVEIPEENRLGTDSKGLGVMLASFQEARAYVGLGAIGSALAAQEAALEYAKQRPQFGGPIAGKQLVQALLADNQVDIDAARLLCYRALELRRRGLPCAVEASIAKLHATEAALRVVDRALQVHGGYGLSPEFPLERLYRSVRKSTIVEGTSEVQRLAIGRALTGINAF